VGRGVRPEPPAPRGRAAGRASERWCYFFQTFVMSQLSVKMKMVQPPTVFEW
jgi:hypothetical protein